MAIIFRCDEGDPKRLCYTDRVKVCHCRHGEACTCKFDMHGAYLTA